MSAFLAKIGIGTYPEPVVTVVGGKVLSMIDTGNRLSIISQTGTPIEISTQPSSPDNPDIWELVAKQSNGTTSVLYTGSAQYVFRTRAKLARQLRHENRPTSHLDASLGRLEVGLSALMLGAVFGVFLGVGLAQGPVHRGNGVGAPDRAAGLSAPAGDQEGMTAAQAAAVDQVKDELRAGHRPSAEAVAALPPRLQTWLSSQAQDAPPPERPAAAPRVHAAPPPVPAATPTPAVTTVSRAPAPAAAAAADDTSEALAAMNRVSKALTADAEPSRADLALLPPDLRKVVDEAISETRARQAQEAPAAQAPAAQAPATPSAPPRADATSPRSLDIPWVLMSRSAAGDPYGIPSIPENGTWSSVRAPTLQVPAASRGIRTMDDLKVFGVKPTPAGATAD